MKRFPAVLLSIAFTLCVLPFFSLLAEAEVASFSDVPEDAWFAPYVELCAERGLLSGVGEGRFSPNTQVNNDEALVMAARALWQSDGGEGPLPAGLTPEALVELLGEDQRQLAWPALDDAKRLSELWPYDGFCYLARRCPELGYQLPDYCFNTYPATRQEFFALLALAGRDLPAINDVDTVPGCRDEAILHLYRAGILSGADGYGSFMPQRHLTRAEAAAALARLADPALRLEFDLEPAPWTGYALTELGPDAERPIETYPVALSGKILTLDGQTVDYPVGQLIGGTSIDRVGEYGKLHPTLEEPGNPGNPWWDSYAVLVDVNGAFPIPPQTYDDLYPLSGGGFLAMERQDGGEYEEQRWYVLSKDGTAEKQLPSTYGTPDNNWYDYNEGLCPWLDVERGLWGYVDGDGQWAIPPQWSWAGRFLHGQAMVDLGSQSGVIDTTGNLVIPLAERSLSQGYLSPGSDAPMRYRWENWAYHNDQSGWIDDQGNPVPGPGVAPDTGIQPYYQNGWFCDGQTYYDLEGRQCSETFDWCGPLTADGRGFVGLSGQIYRIEFTR